MIIENYCIWAVISFLLYSCALFELGLEPFYPSCLYKNTNMNWIGCYATSVSLFVIVPAWGIVAFIWWIFHVGRKVD